MTFFIGRGFAEFQILKSDNETISGKFTISKSKSSRLSSILDETRLK